MKKIIIQNGHEPNYRPLFGSHLGFRTENSGPDISETTGSTDKKLIYS